MIVFPNAKINLGLNVTQKRPDGYHNILSVFFPVPLCDILEAVIPENKPEGFFELSFSGLEIPGSADSNLLKKVHTLISSDYALPPLRVHLHKIIPMGGGLGGGSSDAAFFIKLINDLSDINLSWGEMHHYARQTGSDCSFFLINKPCLVSETGTELEPIQLQLKPYFMQLVFPGIHLPTPEAYAGIQPVVPQFSPEKIVEKPIPEWKEFLFNDFESYAFKKHPELQKIKAQLYENGALYAAMTGSGSTLFGIFDKEPGQSATFDGLQTKIFSL